MTTAPAHDDTAPNDAEAPSAPAHPKGGSFAHRSPKEQAAARVRAEARRRAKMIRNVESPTKLGSECQSSSEQDQTNRTEIIGKVGNHSAAPSPHGVLNLPPLLELLKETTAEPEAATTEESNAFQWLQRVTTPSASDMRRWPKSPLSRGYWGVKTQATRLLFACSTRVSSRLDESWASSLLDRREWPTRPLRIGVCEPSLLQNLERTTGQCVVEWVAVSNQRTSHDAFKKHTLDAHLRMDARGGLLLAIPESRQRQAAWHDWSMVRPVTFANLFPGRVDCSELTLSGDLARPGATWFLRSLVEAAAGLSRHPSRLSTEDRLRGRTPRIDTLKAVDLPPTGDPTRDAQRLMIRGLWESLRDMSELPARHAAVPAARLVTAFVAGVDDDLPEANRTEMAETAAVLTPQEPEVLLRLAATRFASCNDSLAIDALLSAERLLRGNEMNAGSSQLPFLQAELEAGRGTNLSLGRVAAGITLVSASLDASKLAYLRDDVLDDARYSDWLIPKDQDRRVLVEVFRAIMAERAIRDSHRLAA